MKIPPFTIAFFGVLSVSLSGTIAEEKEEPTDPLPVIEPLLELEPTIAVMPTEVSLDGIDHPALGRSLSDSLIGGLLAQGRSKVISYEEGKLEVVPPLKADSPAEAVAGILGRRLGAQKVLVPRLVGEDDFYRFTVKEVDTGDYEVSRVFELSHAGDREAIFGFVPLVLSEFEKEEKVAKAGRAPGRDPVIKIWSWEEFRRDFGEEGEGVEGEWPPKATPVERPPVSEKGNSRPEIVRRSEGVPATDTEKKAASPEVENARARGRRVAEMVALGKITSVNDQWGFCVIDMTGRKLKPAEEIEIREGETEAIYATLVVTRVEGNKAIADLAEGQGRKRLLPGDVVFGWEFR